MKDSFEAKKKDAVVILALTDWHCGLTCKLLICLPHKYMVKMMELAKTEFTLTISNMQSKLRCLRKDVS